MWVAAAFLLGSFLGIAGTLVFLLWYTIPRIERFFLFRPARDVVRTPLDLGVPYEQVFIDTPDHVRLSAWHLCPADAKASVIYFHGNGGNLGTLIEIFSMFFQAGLQVFAVDYRGYGWSTGVPSEEALYADGLATVRYFNANFQLPRVPVVYWGRSLGSSVAANVAGQVSPSGLILETAFPSKSSLMEHYPQFRFFYPFSRCRFETVKFLEGHDFPVLLLHGDKDKTIPLKQGQILYNQLTGPKEFFRVDGAGHIDIHMRDSAAYMARVLQFVERVQPMTIN